MRCKACDKIMTNYELTKKFSGSGEFVDLCNECSRFLVDDDLTASSVPECTRSTLSECCATFSSASCTEDSGSGSTHRLHTADKDSSWQQVQRCLRALRQHFKAALELVGRVWRRVLHT